MLGLQPALRTFPCPHCGAATVEIASRCASCQRPIDQEQARLAADKREKFLAAFASANSLVITARAVPGFVLMLRFLFFGPLGFAGLVMLLVLIPAGLVRWFWRYRGPFPDPEWPQVRRWLLESSGIWLLTLAVVSWFSWLIATHPEPP
jgi:hypothetical protein